MQIGEAPDAMELTLRRTLHMLNTMSTRWAPLTKQNEGEKSLTGKPTKCPPILLHFPWRTKTCKVKTTQQTVPNTEQCQRQLQQVRVHQVSGICCLGLGFTVGTVNLLDNITRPGPGTEPCFTLGFLVIGVYYTYSHLLLLLTCFAKNPCRDPLEAFQKD